jgi:hypothetical protein
VHRCRSGGDRGRDLYDRSGLHGHHRHRHDGDADYDDASQDDPQAVDPDHGAPEHAGMWSSQGPEDAFGSLVMYVRSDGSLVVVSASNYDFIAYGSVGIDGSLSAAGSYNQYGKSGSVSFSGMLFEGGARGEGTMKLDSFEGLWSVPEF